MTKKNEVAIKVRQTKLSKKSSEELIEIILRKDKTEKNLNAQIVGLKEEVNNLQKAYNAMTNDMDGTMQTLESYKDRVKALNEVIDAQEATHNSNNKYLNDMIIGFKTQLKAYKLYSTIVSIIVVILAVY